jgi:hypothetical protein
VSGPFPLQTLAPTITAAGISAPPFSDILSSLQTSQQAIFGADISLDPDDQDGQMTGLYAFAQSKTNDSVIAAYNSFSPATAIGAGLSTVVKINGLRRLGPSNSSALIIIGGQAGTIISGGILLDANQNQWALPPVVVIQFTGVVEATAICLVTGAIAAPAGTIGDPNGGGSIFNPIPGWQTATNPEPAILGAPIELDAQLRLRQTVSTSLPAITPREAIEAAILAIPGVNSDNTIVIDNDEDQPDINNIPGHTIVAVVSGGDANAVAAAIALKKSPGCGTYGTTSIVVLDSMGVPDTINFFELLTIQIFVSITIQPLQGYLTTTGNLIAGSIIAAINGLPTGQDIHADDLSGPAKLQGDAATESSGLQQSALDALSKTYIVRSLTFGLSVGALSTNDVPIAFYATAICSASNITLNLTTLS